VFRDRVEKHKEEIAELEEHEKIIEKEKPVSIFIFKICHISCCELNFVLLNRML